MNDRIETMARNMELYKALLAAKPNMPVIKKRRSVTVQKTSGGSYKYSYADLADLDSDLAPVLTEHKLLVAFEMHDADDGTPILTGMLVHPDSGGYLTSEWKVTGRTPQDQGSSITYGRRYLTGILTGVITDDDTDGQQESPGAPAAPPRRPARPVDRATPQQVEQLGVLSRQVNMPQLMHTTIGRQATPDDITSAEATKLIDAANTTQS
jgi:ERF superfamily